MSQPQNLRADDLQHRTSRSPGTPSPETPDDLVALVGVATPRLHTGEPTVPASVRHADKLTPDALSLRLKALTRLGAVTSPTTLTNLTALTTPQTDAAPIQALATPDPAASQPVDGEPEVAGAPPELVVVPGGGDEAPSVVDRKLKVVPVGVVAGNSVPGVRVPGVRVPEVGAWAGRLVLAVSEVLVGDRPISQLVRFTDEAVFGELNRRVRLLGLNTTAGTRSAKERTTVRSVRVCQPAPNVAEVAAHLRHGNRSRAIALRLEIRRSRWVCTALELG